MFAIFPEILQAVQKGDPETLACLARKYFAGQRVFSPRLSVESLLLEMGVQISRETFPHYARLQVLDHRGQYHVTISIHQQIHDSRELNFTLAHLLGHLFYEFMPLMARAELNAEAYQLEAGALARLLNGSQSGNATRRAQVDAFAMALLLPLGMVKKAHQTLSSLGDTAQFFHVNSALLEYRLKQLGLLSVGAKKQQPNPSPVPKKPIKQAPASAVMDRSAAPSAPKAEKKKPDSSSSLARVQKSVANMSYKREDARATANEDAPAATQGAEKERWKRLRELAKRIDKSVEV